MFSMDYDSVAQPDDATWDDQRGKGGQFDFLLSRGDNGAKLDDNAKTNIAKLPIEESRTVIIRTERKVRDSKSREELISVALGMHSNAGGMETRPRSQIPILAPCTIAMSGNICSCNAFLAT